jgi:hypothetical protein
MKKRTTEINFHEKKYHVLFQEPVWFVDGRMSAIHSGGMNAERISTVPESKLVQDNSH